ncbi:MAG: TIGR02679 family protein [Verrucomicrobiota bacterium]
MDPLSDNKRLRDIFSSPALGWIIKRLVARMTAGRPLGGTLVKSDASAEERRAVDGLIGRKSTAGANLSLNLDALERSMQDAGLLTSLVDIVLTCHGPVENQRKEIERQRRQWEALFEAARTRCDGAPKMLNWVDRLAADGALKRISRGNLSTAEDLMRKAWRVIMWKKPGRPEEILLANLAAECAGDSHALDRGQPLATLCLRAIAAMHDIDGQLNAKARREAWAAVGVIIDDLSAPVLVFNLHAAEGSMLEELLALHRRQGQPAFLTYRQLSSAVFSPAVNRAIRTVYICENPSVVSAAAREIGANCRPLICTNGQPTSSVRLLLTQLQQAGAELRCHADFDWAGLRIVDQLVKEHAATPWRMEAENYLEAVGTIVLAPQAFISPWQPELADAIRSNKRAVFEEQVIHSLLSDLQGESPAIV